MLSVHSDRNGQILVLSDKGLLQIHDGKLVPYKQHRPLLDMQIIDMKTYRDQFVYLTDKVVLSNAWAGKLYDRHQMNDIELFEMGSNFNFLATGKNSLVYFDQDKKINKLKNY